ncbi:unnamed protein product [Cuscuta europaea]|uniref:Uncharacterized protein n=1 Tax=Cuscuta europaea TaxID=41803 RepID=A0A9P1A3Q3_CUSEU|nr:unnamed protein product [Cuscuta europaea]
MYCYFIFYCIFMHCIFMQKKQGAKIMEMWGDNSLDKKFERGWGLTQSMDGVSRPIEENSRQNEDTKKQDMFENIQTWEDRDNYGCSNVDSVFELNYSESVIKDDTFLVSDSTGNNYCIYFNIENYIFETKNPHSFFSEPFYLSSNSSNLTQMNEVSNESNSQIEIAQSVENSIKLQIERTTITTNEK